MLDLKTLEQKLDLSLDRETEESLTNWLKNKRIKSKKRLFEKKEAEKGKGISVRAF